MERLVLVLWSARENHRHARWESDADRRYGLPPVADPSRTHREKRGQWKSPSSAREWPLRQTDASIKAPVIPRDVSEQNPPSGRGAFVRALDVRRNARWGFAFGVLVAVAVFVFFVVVPGTYRSTLFYVALGFVLAVSLGGLATALLTLRSAVRLARET